jgi:hypothetical protein
MVILVSPIGLVSKNAQKKLSLNDKKKLEKPLKPWCRYPARAQEEPANRSTCAIDTVSSCTKLILHCLKYMSAEALNASNKI